MNVNDVVETVVETCPDAILVSALGTATSSVRAVTGDAGHFYFGAAMGSTIAGAMGLAEAVPDRQVIAVIGDGDFLMGANSLWSLSAYPLQNLIVVVLANGIYGITGGQPIPASPRMAAAAKSLEGLDGLVSRTSDELREALRTINQPGLIEAHITSETWPGPSPFVDPASVVSGVRVNVAAHLG